MLNVSFSEAHGNFAEILDKVGRGKQRIVVGDEGAPLAVLVPVEDLSLLEGHGGPGLPDGEQRFKDFAETASDWFWETDENHRFTYFSGRYGEIGLEMKERLGKTRLETTADDTSQQKWRDHLDDLAAHRAFSDLQHSGFARDGGIVLMTVSGKPIFDEAGAFKGYRGTATDITDRIEAEAALRESEARFRDFAETASDWFWETDMEQRFTYYSGSEPLDDVLGLKNPSSIIGKTRHELWRGREDPALIDTITDYMARGAAFSRLEFSHRDPECGLVHISLSGKPVTDDGGNVIAYRGTGRDVTERKRADEKIRTLNDDLERRVIERTEELQRSELRLRDAMEALPAGFALYDGEDRLALCNETYRGQVFQDRDSIPYGATFEEILKHKIAHGQFPQAEGRAPEWLTERLRIHRETPGPIEQMHSDGRWYWIDERRIGEGSTVVVSTNITERKQAEEELRAAQVDLLRQERLATLGQLTATVSHELRNPLGVIRTSVFIVRDGLDGAPSRIVRSLERIERSVIRCDRIIDEMLDFTRISELEIEMVPIDAWLAGVLEEQAVPREVTLHHEFTLSGVGVGMDRDRLRRAVINVFDNACQAMVAGASERSENGAHRLTVRTGTAAGRIELVFEDTGPGIPPETLPKVFEPLFSTKGFGVGLGLPVVRQIMEQHGGGVEIENMAGGGARVRLWLPGGAPGP